MIDFKTPLFKPQELVFLDSYRGSFKILKILDVGPDVDSMNPLFIYVVEDREGIRHKLVVEHLESVARKATETEILLYSEV